ncbi:DUF1330 domain-containing protein [Yoonia sediminilitoris]|uniref:Uncharacterized protein (DUF1330 family) n=1 Tax=Yoonia sediminilitoris TaxID=1286148 RepID=A0A2T6K6F6_9RHOB|nr:DUF1330 domain-containing protein [Yoonia sediminilitoris]PUB10249.1 uncharacterized protein (DUF1330 family) [Yoonia sediminilitoris]RCW89757.1 uncharacterized protein (DUF1330 family) [Yoonia sediminilitoris]
MSVYVVGQLNIHTPDDYEEYLAGFTSIFERYKGELLATSKQETEVLEGTWAMPRTVLMRFPTAEAARSWYNDPDYQKLAEIRRRNADTNLVIVHGID